MKYQRAYLLDILHRIERIEYTSRRGEDFFMRHEPDAVEAQDAVLRNLEIIGEIVKRLTVETRALSETVDWRKIAGLRDVLAHDYDSIDLEIVWEIVASDLPVLKSALVSILEQLPEDD